MINDLWYKNAVIYSLDLDTFMDANGDGVGDFEGLIRRLDYLEALGVDALWLAPFQPSPKKDNGYDISDYYGVDPLYGSSGDFVEFVHHARKRGIRVVLDLVVNHTSDQHPWFKSARASEQSPHRDWYVWSKTRPRGWNKGMVFPGVQKATWTRDAQSGWWYQHRFYKFQPDLNMDNPAVRAEIRRIIGYWLELGACGFRVDAVPFIIESGRPGSRRTQHFEYIAEMRQFMQWRAGDAVLLGEANVLPRENRKYFGDGRDGLHMMFNFYVNQHLFHSLAVEDAKSVSHALEATRELPRVAQWGAFLRNHDELDIERLPEAKRSRVFERFGPQPEMQLYHRGIRRRLASMLGDRAHIELAYSLLFALPGAPVLRYGDEIGMGEDLSLNERDAVRTPMQWANEPNGGFSTAKRTVHPVIATGPYGYPTINVEAQRRDGKSLLSWMVQMIRMRKECPEIGWGQWERLELDSPAVLGLLYAHHGRRVLVLHNFSREPQSVKVRLRGEGAETLTNLVGEDESRNRAGVHRITLESYGYRWYRVGGSTYSIHREREPPPAQR